jgi:polyisoprenyl-teichoic acid--peptidoglycan teichoic acid transferase
LPKRYVTDIIAFVNSPTPQGSDPLIPVTKSPEATIAATPLATAPDTTTAKPPKKRRSWKRRIAIAIVLFIIALPLYFGVKVLLATKNIITKNTFHSAAALAGGELKGEGDGRINILLMGIGGLGHEGPELTDTIMLASIDPRSHSVSMLSIPRDFWVASSPTCPTGCKINAINVYGEQQKINGGGAAALKSSVSKMLDVPVHYFVKVDFSGFKSAVDAVGGVDINVDKTLSDPFYPNEKNGYSPLYISAGMHHMNGDLALRYARSRETTSDFDRAARQQKLLAALRQKALSLGTLTNPKKVSDLIDVLGSHVKTDLQLWEMSKLSKILTQIDQSKIQTKVLDPTTKVVQAGNIGGGYVLYPSLGLGKYSAIQQWTHTYLTDSYLQSESATISLYNGTNLAGLAAKTGDFLKAYGYDIAAVANAPAGSYPKTILTDYSGGKKPYTIKFLENRFHATVVSAPASQSADGAEIKLVLGQDFKLSYINAQ